MLRSCLRTSPIRIPSSRAITTRPRRLVPCDRCTGRARTRRSPSVSVAENSSSVPARFGGSRPAPDRRRAPGGRPSSISTRRQLPRTVAVATLADALDADARGLPEDARSSVSGSLDRLRVLRDEVVDRLVDGELPLVAREAARRRELDRDLVDEAVAARDQRVGDLVGRVPRTPRASQSAARLPACRTRPYRRQAAESSVWAKKCCVRTRIRPLATRESPPSLGGAQVLQRAGFVCPNAGSRRLGAPWPLHPLRATPTLALRSYLALLAGRAPSSHFLEVRFRVGEQQLGHEFHRVYDQRRARSTRSAREVRVRTSTSAARRARAAQGTKDAVVRRSGCCGPSATGRSRLAGSSASARSRRSSSRRARARTATATGRSPRR